jgi:plastocyanin
MNRIRGLIAVAAVILTGACGGSGATPPQNCAANTFCMVGNQFSPRALTVAAGTVVTWTNTTNSDHNVTFTSAGAAAAKPGDGSGSIPTFFSGAHTRVFTTPGTYPFTCTIHPGMTGSLTVQ